MNSKAIATLGATVCTAALAWWWTNTEHDDGARPDAAAPAAVNAADPATLATLSPNDEVQIPGPAATEEDPIAMETQRRSGAAEAALDRWLVQRLEIESIFAPLASLVIDRLEAEGAPFAFLPEGVHASADLALVSASTVVRHDAAGARLYVIDHVRFPAFAELERRVASRNRRGPFAVDSAETWHTDEAFVASLRQLTDGLEAPLPGPK